MVAELVYGEDEEHGDEDECGHGGVVEGAAVVFDPEAQAGDADDAEDGGFAEVHVEPEEGEGEDGGGDLGPDGVADFLEPVGAGAIHGFPDAGVDLLALFGEELAEHADGVDGDGEDAGEGAEAQGGDEEDRQEEDGDGAEEGEEDLDGVVNPVGCERLGAEEAEGEGGEHAQRGAEDGDLEGDGDDAGGESEGWGEEPFARGVPREVGREHAVGQFGDARTGALEVARADPHADPRPDDQAQHEGERDDLKRGAPRARRVGWWER